MPDLLKIINKQRIYTIVCILKKLRAFEREKDSEGWERIITFSMKQSRRQQLNPVFINPRVRLTTRT